jgi:CxxC-x17-CxxC domain-containing protein
MRDFRSNNRFGGRGGGGGRAMMHQTTCDKCGRSCEVPFQPTGEKPVYCNECFAATGGRDGQSRDGGFRGPRFGGRSSAPSSGKDYSRDINAINAKLDKIMVALNIQDKAADMPMNHEAPVESMNSGSEATDDSFMVDDLMSTEE